jgi:copper(I)-binding protein
MRNPSIRNVFGVHALAFAFIAFVIAGCTSPAAEHTDHPMAAEVSLRDQWAAATDGQMAAVFGTLSNEGHHEARIVSGNSPAAGRVEVHEVVGDAGAKTMRPKDGGIVLAAGSSHELTPGGDHLMLMDLTGPLAPGTDFELTVQFEDGSTLPVTVQVRDFAGANEEYQPKHNAHG